MTIFRKELFSLLIVLAFIPIALGTSVSGGTSASIDSAAEAHGELIANNDEVTSTASSKGPVTLGLPIYVEDYTGKHAEIMLDVVNGQIFNYKAEFKPMQGIVPTTGMVSTKQTVNIKNADKIIVDAKAGNKADNSASVDVQISRVGTYGAEFMGETDSYATANSAGAKIDGNLKGALKGTAKAANIPDVVRDSEGGGVDCDLLMKSQSVWNKGLISGRATFDVDDDWGGKIQSAVDGALDGDRIKVAPGTYRENIGIDKSITIKGAGASKTIVDGQETDTVFSIGTLNNNAEVTLSGLTIENGRVSPVHYSAGGIYNKGKLIVQSCLIQKNGATPLSSGGPGGILNFGELTIKDSEISKNWAWNDVCGIDNRGIATILGSEISDNNGGDLSAGGIINSGSLVIKDSEITGNRGEDTIGGGIINSGTAAVINCRILHNDNGIRNFGAITIKDSDLSDNSGISWAGRNSGGIYNEGTAIIVNTMISRNYGGGMTNGAGISNIGELTLKNCKIYDNYASGYDDIGGGGIYNSGKATISESAIFRNKVDGLGGGIYNEGGALKLFKSMVTLNTAIDGGGIYNDKGTLELIKSDVSQNDPNNIVG